MSRAAALASALLALLAAAPPAAAQRAGRRTAPEPEITYPWRLFAVDALRGHLVEGPFKEPGGVCYDAAADELYVADMKNALVGVFDPEGVPLFAFGGRGRLVDPRRVRVAAEGTIFVLDADADAVKAFSYRGEPLAPVRFRAPGDPPDAPPLRVGSFELDAAGRWYVADAGAPRVIVYAPDLEPVLTIPRADDVGELGHVSGLAVSSEGLIAVIDQQATPVQVFDAEGRFVSGFGSRDVGVENFTAPVDVAFDAQGYLYVVDMLRHDVKVFDVRGRFQAVFGGWFSPETRGRGPGEMLYPSGIALAPDGRVYVSERFGNRVQIFERRPRAAGPEGG